MQDHSLLLYQRHGPCHTEAWLSARISPNDAGRSWAMTLYTTMRAQPLLLSRSALDWEYPLWAAGVLLSCLVNMVTWDLLGFQELGAPCPRLGLWSAVGAYLASVVAAAMWHHTQMGGSCSCRLHFGWHRASSSFLSPPCAVSHSLFKELPKFMRKYLVLSLPQILTHSGFSWHHSLRCESYHS